MVHGAAGCNELGAKLNLWSPAAAGTAVRPRPDGAQVARAVPRAPDDRQQHGRPAGRAGDAEGDRRRPLPVERRVPHAVASEADRGLRRLRRDVARSDVRAALRPGDADSVDAAVHRERRPGRRLRVRLRLRLHGLDQLGVADRAAARHSRSARGVREAVRRRRLARGAREPSSNASQHSGLRRHRDDVDEARR